MDSRTSSSTSFGIDKFSTYSWIEFIPPYIIRLGNSSIASMTVSGKS